MMPLRWSKKILRRAWLIAPAVVALAVMAWWASPDLFEQLRGPEDRPALAEPLEPLPSAGPQNSDEQAALALPAAERGKKLVQLARAYEAQGKFADAARVFLLALDALPEMADGLLDEAARMEMAAGRYADAVAVLKRLAGTYGGRPVAADALRRLAEAYERQGDVEHAVATHRTSANGAASVSVKAYHLVRAGELLEQAGRRREAAALFNQVLGELEPNRFSVRAMMDYHRTALADDPGRRAEHATAFGLRMFEAKAYQQAGEGLDLAIRLRQTRGSSATELRELIEKAAFALFATHNNVRAAYYYELLAASPDADQTAVLYHLCKLYVRLGDAPRARTHLQKLLRAPNASGYARFVRYQLALLDIQEQRYAAAYGYLSERVRQGGGDTELLEWLAFWTAYRSGRAELATTHLDRIAKLRRLKESDRYQYWRGRLLLEQGDPSRGLALLRAVNREHPSGYYGWRAAELLKKLRQSAVELDAAMNPPAASRLVGAAADHWWSEYDELDGLGRISHCLDVGLPRPAAAELARMSFPATLAPPHAYELAQMCARAGRHDLARQLVTRDAVYNYLRGRRESLLDSYYRFALPLGYAEDISANAVRFRLPPALIYAIIYNESAFKPQVVSPAYAVGLMQILPTTGQQLATALGESFHEESLYDPPTNIRYGCRYLRDLLDALGNDPALAAAAYNAGPQAVKQWLAHKRDVEQDLFIEEIPYQETNRYVRKVLTTMRQYEIILDHRSR